MSAAENMNDLYKKDTDSTKDTILVVDDLETNRLILEDILYNDYNVEQAGDGIEALTMLLSGSCKPSLVLLDIMMPEMDGFEVLKTMKQHDLTKKIPVMFITAADPSENETRGLQNGASDYIVKPFIHSVVKARVDNQIELFKYREKLEELVAIKANELIQAKEKMLITMASLIEYRNLESGEHVKRTAQLSQALIEKLLSHPKYEKELTEKDYHVMIKAMPLHDVGKIVIPDRILLKPDKLTPEEYDVIKTHTVTGSNIIKSLPLEDDELYLRHCYDICRYHHERWDGNGYPDKLKSEEIPLAARVLSIVDVYDALVSKRVYKAAFTHDEAIKLIRDGAGTQFDPEMVAVLLENDHIFDDTYINKK